MEMFLLRLVAAVTVKYHCDRGDRRKHRYRLGRGDQTVLDGPLQPVWWDKVPRQTAGGNDWNADYFRFNVLFAMTVTGVTQ